MKKLTFEDLENEGLLLYRYVRGSTAQGTAIEGVSDRDTASVYLAHPDQLLGLGFDYQDEVSDERHDNVAWEFNKFMRLLLKSNPTVLEALFVDDEFVEYEHPIITELKKHRDEFVTKQCFKPFGAYAYSQILKCRGLNKKMLLDEEKHVERRSSYSFCYTFYNQGSTKTNNWLEYRGLHAEYCGLNRIPNMRDTYGVFYDWGSHFANCNYTPTEAVLYYLKETFKAWVKNTEISQIIRYSEKFCIGRYIFKTRPKMSKKPFYYRGIFKNDESTEVRLSSIDDKHDRPICHMSYNEDAFRKHCQDYKDYLEWKANRNPVRYAANKDRNYDCYVEKDTEFLTINGWKKYDEISDNELIASIDENHHLEYVPIINRYDDVYSGEIYTFENKYTKFSVTPNHKLLLSCCHRNPNTNFSVKYDANRCDWQFISVENFFSNKRSHYHYIQSITNNNGDNLEFSDDFITLLGAFLSEGHYVYRSYNKEHPYGFRITQIEGNRLTPLMRDIKSITLTEYSSNKRGKGVELTWECRDTDVLSKIMDCSGRYSFEKDIPHYVYTFSKRQLDILLNAMICGDGTNHKKGHRVYYTYSPKMAKSLHTLLVLNGYNAQIYGGDKGSYKRKYKSSYLRHDGKILPCYQVFISKYKENYGVLRKRKLNKHSGWELLDVVNQRIVCFENKNHTLITRNGTKIAFQGNSKNVAHSFRLMNMCIEIANGQGFKVNRSGIDREFLLDVRQHKYEYEDIMRMLEEKKREMDAAIENANLPDEISVDFVNDFVVKVRKEQLNIKEQ